MSSGCDLFSSVAEMGLSPLDASNIVMGGIRFVLECFLCCASCIALSYCCSCCRLVYSAADSKSMNGFNVASFSPTVVAVCLG